VVRKCVKHLHARVAFDVGYAPIRLAAAEKEVQNLKPVCSLAVPGAEAGG
jgi:hypothetical protein